MLDADGIELIHDNAMTILEEVGIEFRDDEALALWRAAGAEVEGSRVRISRELAMETLAHAPAEFTQHARNPERSVGSAGATPCSRPPTARPSCATSTASAAKAPSRTSGTSSS